MINHPPGKQLSRVGNPTPESLNNLLHLYLFNDNKDYLLV